MSYAQWMFWRLLVMVAVVLALIGLWRVLTARADDYPVVTTHAPDFQLYYFGELAVSAQDGHANSFGPTAESAAPISLGQPALPFRHGYFSGRVSANNYTAGGQAGLNTVIHVPNCTLTIRGGLVVSALTPFNQPCP